MISLSNFTNGCWEGYVLEAGRRVYFVLKNGYLRVYKSKKDGSRRDLNSAKSSIHVSKIVIVTTSVALDTKAFILNVQNAQKIVQVKTTAERQKWIVAFSQAQMLYPAELSPTSSLDGEDGLGLEDVLLNSTTPDPPQRISGRPNASASIPNVTTLLHDFMESLIQRRGTVLVAMEAVDEDYQYRMGHDKGEREKILAKMHCQEMDLCMFSMRESLRGFTDLLRAYQDEVHQKIDRSQQKRRGAERTLKALQSDIDDMEKSDEFLQLLKKSHVSQQREEKKHTQELKVVRRQSRRMGHIRTGSVDVLSVRHATSSIHEAAEQKSRGLIGVSSDEGDSDDSDEFFEILEDWTPQQLDTIKMAEAVMDLRTRTLVRPFMEQQTTRNDDLARFVRARDFNVGHAATMYANYAKWVQCFKPMDISTQTVEKELSEGMMYFHREDIMGRPLMILNITKMPQTLPNESSEMKYIQLVVLMVETACRVTPPNISTFSLLIDFKGFTMANNDMKLTKSIFKLLSDYYPERLGVCLLVDTPWMFNAVWYAIKAFLSPRTAAKIKFVGRKDLSKFVQTSNLPQNLGGTSPFVYESVKSPLGVLSDEHNKNLEI
eukprot:CFRG7549T1